jgi:hypothetical protein
LTNINGWSVLFYGVAAVYCLISVAWFYLIQKRNARTAMA